MSLESKRHTKTLNELEPNNKMDTKHMDIDPRCDKVKIGLLSVSDRASRGIYEDKGLPTLKAWLSNALWNPIEWHEALIADEILLIKEQLELMCSKGCHLILTTGGTGPAKRDVTPEATLSIGGKEMPGFGEQMRQISLNFVPTAILSRQLAVIKDQSLIINLPGQPKSIDETLGGVPQSATQKKVPGIFAAVPYCIDLIGGPYLEAKEDFCAVHRPKTALRSKRI